MSDDLLDRLSADLQPASRWTVPKRLGVAMALGGAAALVGVLGILGPRPDMPQALNTSMFWIKLVYTFAYAGLGVWSVERLSRPGGSARGRLPWIAAPVLGIAGLAALQLAVAAPEARMGMVMGSSASVCPFCILAAALPLFAGLVWALRGLGPTELRAAGAVAGLTAGGAGAGIYALHCPEAGAPFVAVWYSAGIVLTGLLGALLGPRLLRW